MKLLENLKEVEQKKIEGKKVQDIIRDKYLRPINK